MRVGEAIALTRCDVDLRAGVITIRHAKHDRERLVPLHQTTTAALGRYAAERDRLCPEPRAGTFFLSSAGTKPDRSGVGKAFRKISTQIGVRTHHTPACVAMGARPSRKVRPTQIALFCVMLAAGMCATVPSRGCQMTARADIGRDEARVRRIREFVLNRAG